jgi:hypothetical protein
MYVIEALHTVADTVGERSASILRTPGVDIVDQVLPVLINELDAMPERRSVCRPRELVPQTPEAGGAGGLAARRRAEGAVRCKPELTP